MAINKAVRDGLQAEQANVADEMAQLEARLQWLTTRQDALRLILDQEAAPPEQKAPPDTGLRRLGVRDAARAVLKEAGALKPSQVTRSLRDRGYQFKGKMKPGARVGQELWAMAKSGTLSKNSAGEYFLPGEEQDEPNTAVPPPPSSDEDASAVVRNESAGATGADSGTETQGSEASS